MSSRPLVKDSYQPYQLCCALAPLAARCTVCKRDLCEDCFKESHVKDGWMECIGAKLVWKNFGKANCTNAEWLELHPYEQKTYGN
jgi:hypothetical protein